MSNTKTTKRALLSGIMAMILCVCMLIGTTFAWFTDSASTGVNTIQSGKLDIVLEYSTDNGTTWNDAEGKTLNFVAADNRTEILWEPGCTYELPLIRVRNNGNLALKYDLVINGVSGNAKLLEAIEFTANDIAISNFSGTLLNKDAVSDSILIKGHMKEEAGNEYQNLTIEGIGITVYATQYTYESDSYDNTYDKVGAISGGRIEWTGKRYQIAADFAAEGVETLAVNVVDTNGNIITTITPETYTIPDDGVIGDPADGTHRSWITACAAVTGDSSSWQNTAFAPSMNAVPATMQLVINGAVVDVSDITFGVDLWEDIVKSYYAAGADELADNTDATNKTVNIENVAQLVAFSESVNSGTTYSGYTVSLVNDINLDGITWTPIGINADSANKFKGTFDGLGHTISNMVVEQISGDYVASGFFGALNGTVQNLNFKNATVNALSGGSATDNGIAVVAGSIYTSGKIQNVHVDGATINGNRYVGGISGYTYGSVINCSVKNAVITATPDKLSGNYDNGDKVGGIVGYFCSENTYAVSGNTVENVSLKGYRDIGGIIGAGNAGNAVVNNIAKDVTITVDQVTGYYGDKAANAGAIVGRVMSGNIDASNKSENYVSYNK